MKACKIVIALLLFYCSTAFAQTPRIDIEEFRAAVIEKIGANGDAIDEAILGKKIELCIRKDQKVEVVSTKNKEGNYVQVDKTSEDVTFDIYNIQIDYYDNFGYIQLCKGQNCVELKLGPANKPPVDPSNPCNDCADLLDSSLIYYDFKCKKFYQLDGNTKKPLKNLSSLKPKTNDQLQFKIVNINRYIYDIEIDAANVDYTSEMPALFRNLLFGDTSSSSLLGILLNTVSNINALNSAGDDPVSTSFQNFKTELEQFQVRYNQLRAKRLSAYYICPNFDCCSKQPNFTFEEVMKELLDVRIALANLQLTVKKDAELIATTLATNKKLLADCEKKADTFKLITAKIAELEKPAADAKDSIARKKMRDSLVKVKETIKCHDTTVQQLQAKIENTSNYQKFYASLDDLQNTLPTEQELSRLYLFVQNIRQQNNSYITPPIDITGNRFELSMKMYPKVNSFVSGWESGPYDDDELYIDIPILSKPFVSFSSGTFIGIDRHLQEYTYEWQPLANGVNAVTDTSSYRLVQSGYSRLPVGFAAFINFEKKFVPAFGIGISGGVGLTVESKPRIAYLAGPSIFIGDNRQLAITAGFAGMQVDKLANHMEALARQEITYTVNTKPDIQYYKEFKVGTFVALSYTPFGTNKRPVYKALQKEKREEQEIAEEEKKKEEDKAKEAEKKEEKKETDNK